MKTTLQIATSLLPKGGKEMPLQEVDKVRLGERLEHTSKPKWHIGYMSKTPFVACVALAFLGATVPASALTLYAVDGSGKLYRLDTVAHTTTAIGSLPFSAGVWLYGLNSNPVDGKLYVGDSIGGKIYSLNTSTAAATSVTTLSPYPSTACPNGSILQNFAFSPSGVLYGAESFSLCTINLSTGGSTFVGSNGIDNNGLAFAPDGTLYALAGGGGSIYSINPSNDSQLSFIASSSCYVGLTFASDNNLYCSDSSANLYQINPATGIPQFVYNTGLTGPYIEVAAGSPAPAVIYSCVGFQTPFNVSILLKAKTNRAIPLKAQLFDANHNLVTATTLGTAAPPVVNILFSSAGGGNAVDETNLLDPLGQSSSGNQFNFDPTSGTWWFNLATTPYSAAGSYKVSMTAGDTSYQVSPQCSGTFVRQP